MVVEFTRNGKTYQCAAPILLPPPKTIQIVFRPCALKPPFYLELDWLATDDIRGIELYKPVREIH